MICYNITRDITGLGEGSKVAKVCVICNKSKNTGYKISHSNIKNKRKWRPNIQRIKILLNGSPRRVNVCSRCIKAGKVNKVV